MVIKFVCKLRKVSLVPWRRFEASLDNSPPLHYILPVQCAHTINLVLSYTTMFVLSCLSKGTVRNTISISLFVRHERNDNDRHFGTSLAL